MKVNDPFPMPAPVVPAGRPNQRVTSPSSGAARNDATPAGRPGAPAANVAISARSRELHQALRAANAAPDVRPDVVADVQARLRAGTYRFDPDQVARRLLDASA